MSEPRKTVILLILLCLGVGTFFWGRWRLKQQLGQGLDTRGTQLQPAETTPTPSNPTPSPQP